MQFLSVTTGQGVGKLLFVCLFVSIFTVIV